MSWCRFAASSALSSFAIARSRRFRSLSRAACSLRHCISRRFCSFSNASAAARSALSSSLRDVDCFVIRRGFADLSLPTGRSFGSLGCSLNEALEPTGLLRTTPGLTMVAATIAGSWVYLANPRLNSLVLRPQARAAAFMDGAATARSKKPTEV